MISPPTADKKRNWNELIKPFPKTHLLQTSQWAELKSQYGWVPTFLIWEKDHAGWQLRQSQQPVIEAAKPAAAGLLLEREAFRGLRVHYLPKGPLISDWSDLDLVDQVLDDLAAFARERGALQLKIDPDLKLGCGVPGDDDHQVFPVGEAVQSLLSRKGWVFSQEQIQFRNTVLVDLEEEEDALLARMKSKTRYNIRLSGRKGIQIRYGDVSDLPSLYRMYAATSQRGGFAIRDQAYYLKLWRLFMAEGGGKGDPQAQPLIAEFEGQLVAGAVIFKFGNRAWYLHGMSLTDHSEKMAPHLIQWEAMRWAKEQGCEIYDMWGAPDQFHKSDPLWGVYRFKRGFGGQVALTLGAWDFPVKPALYVVYSRLLPRLLAVLRWFGNRRTSRLTRSEE